MAANVGNLAIQISGNAGPLLRELKYTQNAVTHFGNTINRNITINMKEATEAATGSGGLLKTMSGLGSRGAWGAIGVGTASVAALGVAAGFSGARAVQLAAGYQDAAASFEVMTGSAERGSRLLNKIQEFAAATPFQSPELIENARMLMGFGVAAEEILPTLKAIGEVTAGSGGGADRLHRIALVYGQVTAKGKFLADDLRQFTEAGVGVKDFAAVMGVSVGRFRELMEAGQVGSDVVAKAFNKMTGEGGRFSGLMNKLSGNASGRWNAIKENADLALQNVGLSILNAPATSEFFTHVEDLTSRIKANAGQIGEAMSGIADVARAGLIGIENGLNGFNDLTGMKGLKDLLIDIVALISSLPAYAADFGKGLEITGTFVASKAMENLQYVNPLAATLSNSNEIAQELRGYSIDMAQTWGKGEASLRRFYDQLNQVKKVSTEAGDAISRISSIAVASPGMGRRTYLDDFEKTAEDFKKQSMTFLQLKSKIVALSEAGKHGNQGLLTPDAARFGLSNLYGQIKQAVASRLEVKLPQLAYKGTSEAQDVINRSMVKTQTLEEEMLRVMNEWKKLQEETRDLEKRQADYLEKLVKKGGVGGGKI